MALVFVGLSPVLVWFYQEPRLQPIAIVLSVGFVLRGLAAQHLGLLNRNMRFSEVAALEVSGVAFSIAVAITMAWLGWGYWALVARRVAVLFVTTVGAWLLSGWRPGFHLRVEGTGPLVRFGAHNFGAQGLSNFRQNIDKMLLGWRYGAFPLGLYDRAQQMFVLPFNQLTSPLTGVAVSTLSRLRNDPLRYRRYCLEAISVVAFVGMGLSAVLTVAGPDLVILLLGSKWQESGAIFVAFGPSIGMLLLTSTQNWLHLSLGRADRAFRWNLVVLAVSVLGLTIGLLFGPIGVAYANSASLYILFGPGFWYAGRPISRGLASIYAVVWRYFASALTSATACWYLLHGVARISSLYDGLDVFFRVAAVSVACAGAYLACVIVFHRSTKPLVRVLSLGNDLAPWRRRRPQPAVEAIARTSSPN
jgi:PST family polysaccharide transporter